MFVEVGNVFPHLLHLPCFPIKLGNWLPHMLAFVIGIVTHEDMINIRVAILHSLQFFLNKCLSAVCNYYTLVSTSGLCTTILTYLISIRPDRNSYFGIAILKVVLNYNENPCYRIITISSDDQDITFGVLHQIVPLIEDVSPRNSSRPRQSQFGSNSRNGIFVQNPQPASQDRNRSGGSVDGVDSVELRLLYHHTQVGCIIGKGGAKIKELREVSVIHVYIIQERKM
jgi:hypothetical protein